ncbi:hypothetical protein ACOQFL_10160 [Actinopolyspora sp. H202]|uniref:hypothetical protein n=1 Tax=Actinopolyspora sp. H202 TaxID=1500456 RepID=UPI003EE762C6
MGESTGGLIAALVAFRAREAGIPLAAQVLVNRVTDLAEAMHDADSSDPAREQPHA